MCGFTLLHILPYLLLLVMPLYGSFFGKEPIMRLSLFLMGQNVVSTTAARYLLLAEPLVQVAMIVLLVSLRVTLIPDALIWFYDMLLFLSEPIWQVFEAFGVVQLSMSLSQEAADRVDDQPGLVKGYVLTVSGVCYFLSCWLLWSILSLNHVLAVGSCVCLMILVVIVHVCTVRHDSGVLSDAAVVCVASTAFLYDVLQPSCHPVETAPANWTRYASDHTYGQMMVQLARSAPSASHAWAYFSLVARPWFILTSLARVCCVLFAISVAQHLVNLMTARTEDDLYEDTDLDSDDIEQTASFTFIKSPLLIRLVVIFVFTQYMICHMYRPAFDSSWLSWLQSWYPSARWAQIVLLNAAYVYRLYRMDSENESF